jgi:phosphate transport system protein
LLRVEYHEKLESTRGELISLGALVIDAQHQALKALNAGDTALAGRIIADDQMDLMRRAIEQSSIELLWRQQPMASELREVTTIHEIAVDLGIIIGYVTDVAKQAIRASNAASCPDTSDVQRVAVAAETMLTEAMRAFKERDAAGANRVYTQAEKVEAEFTPVVESIEMYMQEHPDSVACCVPLLFVLTAEQRICDRAENIAWHTEEML